MFIKWAFFYFTMLIICLSSLYIDSAVCVNAYALDDTRTEIRLPIVMYHSVLPGRSSQYVVTPTQFENDLRAFINAGYETVFMSQVIDWIDGRGELPAKPIVITFDDGHYNNVHYALPIAKELGAKFSIYPVIDFTEKTVKNKETGNPRYSYLTWEDMKLAYDTGIVEFGNHTYQMHRYKPRYGIGQKFGEPNEEYRNAMERDFKYVQEEFERAQIPAPSVFAYPFGKYTPQGRQLLVDMGFRAMLTCNERVDTIKRGQPETLHELGRFNRSGHYTTETILKKINK